MIMHKLSQASNPQKAFKARKEILEIDQRYRGNTNALKGSIEDDEESDGSEIVVQNRIPKHSPCSPQQC